MSDLITRIMERSGDMLRTAARSRRLDNFPGSLTIGDHRVTKLRPLGGYHRAGITKAGRLSFRGECDGLPVKVYSVHSPKQAALRRAIQSTSVAGCFFPDVVASDDRLVAEAWIDGTPAGSLKGEDEAHARAALRKFIENCRTSPAMNGLATMHAGSFCYLEDYLINRLGIWIHWDPIRHFMDTWTRAYAEIAPRIAAHVSHPDLSANNLVRDHANGRLFIIDNELLGVGRGWILDWHNSWIAGSGKRPDLPDDIPSEFVEQTWRLRQIGSALDASDFAKAAKLAALA